MNINKTLILIGILFSAVLIIENMVVPLRAYVFVWNTYNWALAVSSIITWVMIGYWIHGMLNDKGASNDTDDYDF